MMAKRWIKLALVSLVALGVSHCADDQQQDAEVQADDQSQGGDQMADDQANAAPQEAPAPVEDFAAKQAVVQDPLPKESAAINNSTANDFAKIAPPVVEQPAVDAGQPQASAVAAPPPGGRVMYVRATTNLYVAPGGAVAGTLMQGDHPLVWMTGSGAPTAMPGDIANGVKPMEPAALPPAPAPIQAAPVSAPAPAPAAPVQPNAKQSNNLNANIAANAFNLNSNSGNNADGNVTGNNNAGSNNTGNN